MKINDYDQIRYHKMLIDNCKKEWDYYCSCVDAIKQHEVIKAMSCVAMWQEIAAFIKILPRQIGKTTFLVNEAKALNGIIVCHSSATTNKIQKSFGYYNVRRSTELRGLPFESTWLFIDEYDTLHPNALNEILCYNWKGVMMLGSCHKRI